MARLGTYIIDDNVQGTDKVLGTDTSGQTKNYLLSTVADFFNKSNSIAVGGQVVYKFTADLNKYGTGAFMINESGGGNSSSLSEMTQIFINKNLDEETPVENLLQKIFDSEIQIFGVENRDIFYRYSVSSVTQVAEPDNALRFGLIPKEGRGTLEQDEHFLITGIENEKVTYVHTQAASAAEWYVTHNMNKKPSVTVVDSSDTVIHAQVDYTDLNRLTITLSAPTSGKAYIN